MPVAKNQFCYGNLQKFRFVMALAKNPVARIARPKSNPRQNHGFDSTATVKRSNGFRCNSGTVLSKIHARRFTCKSGVFEK